MSGHFKHVFGPVPSRRLGRLLGVDLVPFKNCSYDCTYCQLGHPTSKTVERKKWVPMDAALDELKHRRTCQPGNITLIRKGTESANRQHHRSRGVAITSRMPNSSQRVVSLPPLGSRARRVETLMAHAHGHHCLYRNLLKSKTNEL